MASRSGTSPDMDETGSMPTTHTLRVPGAHLYYEVRGSGPALLLTGSPMPAASFAGLANALADDHTVITHDPRGIGSSTLDDPASDSLPDSRASDLAAILDAVGVDSADVFGSSGGAVTGLALATGHPRRVHTLVAHEPPVVRLLPDPDAQIAAFRRIAETFRRDGLNSAFGAFLDHVGFARPAPGAAPAEPPSAQALADAERFMRQEMLDTVGYLPDVVALTAGLPRIVVGIGADSGHLLTYITSSALAQKLGAPPVMFPGEHTGFVDDPSGFAKVLRAVLAG
jgi:pimeloyl-ACP methyl ester carboxylesterase